MYNLKLGQNLEENDYEVLCLLSNVAGGGFFWKQP